LPPRPHRKPGQLLNEVKANREAENNYLMEVQLHKDMKRMQRDENLKKKLKDTNFGGRQMPIEDYKKIKDKVEREEYERLAKKERDKFQDK
jgi:Xaa-Pro aminopeptidase